MERRQVHTHLNEKERETILAAAKMAGVPVSRFLRECALQRAEEMFPKSKDRDWLAEARAAVQAQK